MKFKITRKTKQAGMAGDDITKRVSNYLRARGKATGKTPREYGGASVGVRDGKLLYSGGGLPLSQINLDQLNEMKPEDLGRILAENASKLHYRDYEYNPEVIAAAAQASPAPAQASPAPAQASPAPDLNSVSSQLAMDNPPMDTRTALAAPAGFGPTTATAPPVAPTPAIPRNSRQVPGRSLFQGGLTPGVSQSAGSAMASPTLRATPLIRPTTNYGKGLLNFTPFRNIIGGLTRMFAPPEEYGAYRHN